MAIKNISGYACFGQVWKVLWDSQHRLIVVESRKPEERKVFLLAIPLSGKSEIHNIPDINWSLSMVGVIGGKAILQGQGNNSSLPDPVDLYCYDFYKGGLVWSLPGHSFLALSRDYVFSEVFHEGELTPFRINILSGTPEQSNEGFKEEDEEIQYPSIYHEGEEYFDQVKEFLKNKGKMPIKAIEYWEGKSSIAISYFEESEKELQNILMVLDHNGENESYYKIDSNCKGISDGTFFVVKESLVFARDKKEIVILNLNS